jgi:hypothetical protein
MSLSGRPQRYRQRHMVCFWLFLPITGERTDVGIVIVENGVKLRLNIVDTPGYGDQVNNENWYVR